MPIYFFSALSFNLLGKFSLVRIAMASFPFHDSHALLSVLQGALDVWQDSHAFHLSPRDPLTVFLDFSWRGSVSLLAFRWTHFACLLFLSLLRFFSSLGRPSPSLLRPSALHVRRLSGWRASLGPPSSGSLGPLLVLWITTFLPSCPPLYNSPCPLSVLVKSSVRVLAFVVKSCFLVEKTTQCLLNIKFYLFSLRIYSLFGGRELASRLNATRNTIISTNMFNLYSHITLKYI